MNHSRQNRQLALAVLLVWTASVAFGFSRPPVLHKEAQKGKHWKPTKIPAGTHFVGRETCAECHQSKVAAQAKSSMARALEHVAEAPILSSHRRLTFQQGQFRYEILRQGDQSL